MTTVDQLEDMLNGNRTSATSFGTSLETVEDHPMAHKIDRLSLLPNELLDYISDLAYSIDTPSTGPLSKHLLPFHIIGIYRRISLRKPISIAKLVRKINESPGPAKTVKMLRVDVKEDKPGSIEAIEATEIEQFLRQLVHLEWLDLGKDRYEWLDQFISTQSPALSTPLRHITSGASSFSRHPLLDFISFLTLRSLHITTYEMKYPAFDTSSHRSLPLLTHLTVSGLYAESLSIASFCALCPALTHLTLNCTSSNYTPLLEILPTSLVYLELDIRNNDEGYLCDRELSRFTALRHLSIGHHLFSYDLPTYLYGLLALETLELGKGRISTDGMRELFEKVPIIRLKLGLTVGEIGYRLEVDERGSAEGRWLPGEGRLIAGDWVTPEFDLQGAGDFTLEGPREMVRVAEELGIEVEGSIIRSIKVMDAYYLEIANIAIYRCFRDKTFDPYMEVRTHNLHDRLPALDLDSLDPTRLKIRKIELEKKGWFALTLEN